MIVTNEMLDSDEFAALFLHCKNAQAAKAEILEYSAPVEHLRRLKLNSFVGVN